MSELPMRTTCFSVALCKGTVYRNVSDSRQEGRTSDTRLLRRKNKKAFSCVCSESDRVWWWYQLCQQAGKTGRGARERAVPTKSWNVRPEWNSCSTLCPDCLTACDSRENNRINNHSLRHTETERDCPSLQYLLWTNTAGTFRIFLQPFATKRGNFQQPDFEQWVQQPMGSLRKTEEVHVVQSKLNRNTMRGDR